MAKAHSGILDSDAPEDAERKLVDTVEALQVESPQLLVENLRPLIGLAADGETGADREPGFFDSLKTVMTDFAALLHTRLCVSGAAMREATSLARSTGRRATRTGR